MISDRPWRWSYPRRLLPVAMKMPFRLCRHWREQWHRHQGTVTGRDHFSNSTWPSLRIRFSYHLLCFRLPLTFAFTFGSESYAKCEAWFGSCLHIHYFPIWNSPKDDHLVFSRHKSFDLLNRKCWIMGESEIRFNTFFIKIRQSVIF